MVGSVSPCEKIVVENTVDITWPVFAVCHVLKTALMYIYLGWRMSPRPWRLTFVAQDCGLNLRWSEQSGGYLQRDEVTDKSLINAEV
jgi:hypothetical protein